MEVKTIRDSSLEASVVGLIADEVVVLGAAVISI